MTKLKDWSQNLNNNNSKREELLPEAERLFIYEYMPATAIARKLNLNRKTVNTWRAEQEWDKKRGAFLKSKMSFHNEMYEFARKLMSGIISDMEAGEKIDPGRMYTFCKIIPMFTKVKNYEDLVAKKEEKATPKGLTPELIAQIEEEILGITHNEDTNETK